MKPIVKGMMYGLVIGIVSILGWGWMKSKKAAKTTDEKTPEKKEVE